MVPREALEGLQVKYAEMLAMRVASKAPGKSERQIRARMADLSHRFPGALREIDDLEMDEIKRRVAALESALHEGGEVERWMEAVALFHTLARGALCAKRWLGRRKHVDAEVERAFAAAVSDLSFPEDARGWIGDLARIASPPRGRLTDLLFARMAREMGIPERDTRLLVFGVPRRERRGR
jgi:hypothetical protein